MNLRVLFSLVFFAVSTKSFTQIIPYQRPTPAVKKYTVGVYPNIRKNETWDGREDGYYSVKFKVKGLKPGEIVFLADHHIGGKYLRDTAEVDKNGLINFNGSFNTKKPSKFRLQRGMYLFVLPEKKDYFEFLIDDDQDFTIHCDTSWTEHDYYKKMRVEGSDENARFVKYQNGKMQIIEKLVAMDNELKKDSTPANIKKMEPRKVALLREKDLYDSVFIAQNQNSMIARFLYSLVSAEYPKNLPTKADGTKDSAYPFNYFRAHYWDHVDFNEDALVRMPVNILKQRLDFYFDKVIVPDADTCIEVCNWLLDKVKNTIENEKYLIWYLTNRFESSNIMGLDRVFVHLALSQYCGGKTWWVDSNTVAKMCENAYRRAHSVIGATAPELQLKNQDSVWINTSSINAPYTIMIFWDPTCGHCREVMPKLAKLYEANKQKGWKVIALSSGDKKKEWYEYLKEHPETKGFTHLIRGEVLSQKYSDNLYAYYVFASPTIFIVDANKKIIANRIDVDKIEEFLDHMTKMANKKEATSTKDKK